MAKISILGTNEPWLRLANGFLMKYHQSNGWLLLGLSCKSRPQYQSAKCATQVSNGAASPAIESSWCLRCSRMCCTADTAAGLYKAVGNVNIAEVPHSKLTPVQDINKVVWRLEL
jgi:hypothetical protein